VPPYLFPFFFLQGITPRPIFPCLKEGFLPSPINAPSPFGKDSLPQIQRSLVWLFTRHPPPFQDEDLSLRPLASPLSPLPRGNMKSFLLRRIRRLGQRVFFLLRGFIVTSLPSSYIYSPFSCVCCCSKLQLFPLRPPLPDPSLFFCICFFPNIYFTFINVFPLTLSFATGVHQSPFPHSTEGCCAPSPLIPA